MVEGSDCGVEWVGDWGQSDGLRIFQDHRSGGHLIKFVPENTLKLILRAKLTLKKRFAVHRVMRGYTSPEFKGSISSFGDETISGVRG